MSQGLYARTFNCNLEEAKDGNLDNYSCLAEFFRRKLKNGVRPIDSASAVVAPSDGTVLNFGRVTAGEFHVLLFATHDAYIKAKTFKCLIVIHFAYRHDGAGQGRELLVG